MRRLRWSGPVSLDAEDLDFLSLTLSLTGADGGGWGCGMRLPVVREERGRVETMKQPVYTPRNLIVRGTWTMTYGQRL
jgi:hypothetical protein